MKSLVNQWHHSSSYLAIASVCLSTTKRAQQRLQYCHAGIDVNLCEWSYMVRYVYWKINTKCVLEDRGVLKEFSERILKNLYGQSHWKGRINAFCYRQVFAYGGNIQVVKPFLFPSTGVPHSHIMRQPQQGATNVVGKSPQDGKLELQSQPQQRNAKAIKIAYPSITLTICWHGLMMNMNFS